MELVDGPTVDDWETALAEEEIARLADELDGYDYIQDQGKAQQQYISRTKLTGSHSRRKISRDRRIRPPRL